MPLGNGDIGLNVWGEEDGDLLFYLSKTDAWDENARLLKLGRIRVSLRPNPFRAGLPFRQTLNTDAGSRFPAFWGPNSDWIPDQDHGSVAAIALQRMLLQIKLDAMTPGGWPDGSKRRR